MSIIEKAAERLAGQRPQADAASPARSDIGMHAAPRTAGLGAHARVHVPPSSVVNPEIRLATQGRDFLLSPEGGRSRIGEAYRVIQRPLLANAFRRPPEGVEHPNLIMIASSVRGEGRSFTALNLAISVAMDNDRTVALVDADLTRPGLSRRLGVGDRPGLVERLADESIGLSRVLLKTDIPKLTVLPAGKAGKGSAELLASDAMKRLLSEVASRYSDRIVLIDSPPVLESTEAGGLASLMGQVVLVIEQEATVQGVVMETLAHLRSSANVFLVLNKCKDNLLSGRYDNDYGYGYGSYG